MLLLLSGGKATVLSIGGYLAVSLALLSVDTSYIQVLISKIVSRTTAKYP